jgi:hypothetical protein
LKVPQISTDSILLWTELHALATDSLKCVSEYIYFSL